MPAYLRYYYANAAGSATEITDRCRLYRTSVRSDAEEASTPISTLIIDDPNGDLDIIAFRRIYIVQTGAPTGRQVVYNGYVADRTVARGPYRNGVGRQWSVTLTDPNWFIGLRVVLGADANRPAETDVARVTWVLTTTEANTFNGSSQWVSSATPVAMDAVDYRGQTVSQILDDCSQASGKNRWVPYFENIGKYGLWYDFASSSNYASAISLSNDLSEVNSSTVFAISEDTQLQRSPSRLVSGVYMPFAAASNQTPYVYVQSTAIGTQYVFRDMSAPGSNVKTRTKALARANRYLADNATEDDVIHTKIIVPAAQVNDLKHGMRTSFKATHLPTYNTATPVRVLNQTVTEISEEFFELEMDLTPLPDYGVCSVNSVQFLSDSGTPATDSFTPIAAAIPAAPNAPSIKLAVLMLDNPFDYLGNNLVVDGAWTMIQGDLHTGDLGYVRSMIGIATGQASIVTWSWGGVYYRAGVGRTLGFAINTAATSPVQLGSGTGGTTLTMPGNLTPGHILIMVAATLDPIPGGANSVPPGWTLVKYIDETDGNVTIAGHGTGPWSAWQVSVYMRCVGAGEGGTAVVDPIFNSSFAHYVFIQEWALS